MDIRLSTYDFSSVKNSWENWADVHQKRQKINPFSGSWCPEAANVPPVGDKLYGRPLPGSKTEYRGKLADIHISEEVVEMCNTIEFLGTPLNDGTTAVKFGRLFQFYGKISHNLVGLLIRARKKGLVHFEGEMLYQSQDEDELIILLKKPDELLAEIEQQKASLNKHSSIGKKYT